MRKNLSLKVLSLMVVGVVALILINQRHPKATIAEPHDTNNLNAAIASQFNDNIREVSARLLETQHKVESIEKQRPSAIPTEITDAIAFLKQELNDLKGSQELPSGDEPRKESQPTVRDIDELLMKRTLSEQEKHYWEALNQKHPVAATVNPAINSNETVKAIPYYTIPAGADLTNTTLLSALIGEVPNEGKLMQPLFPFTALVSRGDLMASNGVSLPSDILGMKINGYAIGVGSFLDDISCVRAYVTSALFTFQDGHFVTIGTEEMKNTTDLVNNDSLGYLTTAFGNPCIHGKYITNAPRVLAAMMASGSIQGVGAALSQWQMSTMTGASGVTQAPTGSFGRFATGGALSEGSVKVADWLEKRIQGSFDMVFVPASLGNHPTHLSLHLTKTIQLDKQPNGRILDYGHLQTHLHDTSLR